MEDAPYTVFIGNFPRNTPSSVLRREVESKGFRVVSFDVKDGFGFMHFKTREDAEDMVKKFNDYPFEGRRLRVEMARGDGAVKRREEQRKINQRPSNTLFVVNFDPSTTRATDIEEMFSPFGKVCRVEMVRNFAFVTMDSIEDAEKAVAGLNNKRLGDAILQVEFAQNRARRDEDRNDRDRDRDRDRERDRDRDRERDRHRSSRRSRSPPRCRPGPSRGVSPPRSSRYEPYRRDSRDRRDYSPPRSRRSPPRRESSPHGRSRSPRRSSRYDDDRR